MSLHQLSFGYVLTGPKILQTETYETFCVSLEGALTPANCTLDLVHIDRETVYSSTQYRIKGSFAPRKTFQGLFLRAEIFLVKV